ncbi:MULTISPECIES: LuxR C-terminal-related transcriptional regulator [unclassified Marinobacterium]|jgi:DNA-binding CsgD family transcriptional regulator|uniref:LuxR C-terminal-related transcriptional regulator n=1 Tax=unclassified Marinobacterium TaxID=2644139 RepID=UPI00156890FA|nr:MULTISPECIES: LuxR C-terminal-related transcriptional regulator [unclassified Marinobacterium]NRP35621.1 hypothetical protein [Marinobacterium sp. xm-d-579]NRP09285.1 hypothetical protein [Marinobacterium sp. xm-g-48]NRP46079.1 hypothetical protein [Marinobacterium sp. xm-d-543]NRP82184.1 hypothetical protein [Marinobacterium sp. xm-d-509]NRQ01096.1 hypothetical protein [Marinobacterium sp. xm-d-530]
MAGAVSVAPHDDVKKDKSPRTQNAISHILFHASIKRQLTKRELDFLYWAARGCKAEESSKNLGLKPETVSSLSNMGNRLFFSTVHEVDALIH